MIRFARGDADGAVADAGRALELVREVKDPQLLQHVFASNIRIAAELGRLEAAQRLADELLPTIGAGARLDGLIELAWVADRVGVVGELRDRLDGLEPMRSLWRLAGREILDAAFEQAAVTFARIGCVPDEAEARLRAGIQLRGLGREADAADQLRQAADFYRAVGATRYLDRAAPATADTA